MNPNGGVAGFDSAAADEQHEAVLRELTHGHELTAHLQAEALRELRGQGQAEATAAFILQEVSRAFTVCIKIMGGSAPAATAPPPDATAVVATGPASARRPRDDGVPRKITVTSTPYSDGYQWRKYGQKRIMRTSFPRCYYRCCYHRERSCPATKLVQQQQQPHGDGDQTMYDVIYVHEHTCHNTAPAEPEAAARSSTPDPLGFSAGLPRQQRGGAGLDRGSKEELEQQALVSSLACVLQGHHQCYSGSGGGTPDGSPSQGRAGDGASAFGLSLDASDDGGLDVMDYDVTDTLYFAASSSHGLSGDGIFP